MKVSVIIPTYCRSSFLCEALDSVLAQNFDDFEVIVVDDGSTDDTEARMRVYGDKVRYVKQENQGISAARNTGLSLAKGDYIALLDDDDWWKPNKLRMQVAILKKLPKVSGVFTDFVIYRGDNDETRNGIQTWFSDPVEWGSVMQQTVSANDVLGDDYGLAPGTLLHIGSIYEQSLENYFVLPSTAIFRRSHMPEGVAFPVHDCICGDWDFFARLSKLAPLCFVDSETTFNRSHSDEVRLTLTKMSRQYELRIDFLKRVYVADESFYAANKQRIDNIWKERLYQRCKLLLLDGDRQTALESAESLSILGQSLSVAQRMLIVACHIPGADKLLIGARAVKRCL